MIIYIYGSDSFKKDIHSMLKHSNIKFRLDNHGEIKELSALEELKNAIKDNPNDIYLIDDAKIIKKNSLNQKIKFLKPKDGIEQEYLLDHGIGDISVDSIDELAKHIIKKLEEVVHEKEVNDIQDSIVEIVEDAYEQNKEDNDYVQLDDELSALLSHRDENEEVNEKQIDDITSLVEEIDLSQNEKEDVFLKDLSFEEDFGKIELIEEEIPQEEKKIDKEVNNQGVDMADEFSEFDTLNEADILAALDGLDNNEVSIQATTRNISTPVVKQTNQSVNLGNSNVDDIAKLISQLLNNKTLEITVKVKD